jgi:hypothetical protein
MFGAKAGFSQQLLFALTIVVFYPAIEIMYAKCYGRIAKVSHAIG